MISKEMTDAINAQINAEIYSAYLYLSFSSSCSHKAMRAFFARP